jgi:hypothetical protein
MKLDLIQRGAIFEDFPEEPSKEPSEYFPEEALEDFSEEALEDFLLSSINLTKICNNAVCSDERFLLPINCSTSASIRS